jgi:hypothetical protein
MRDEEHGAKPKEKGKTGKRERDAEKAARGDAAVNHMVETVEVERESPKGRNRERKSAREGE